MVAFIRLRRYPVFPKREHKALLAKTVDRVRNSPARRRFTNSGSGCLGNGESLGRVSFNDATPRSRRVGMCGLKKASFSLDTRGGSEYIASLLSELSPHHGRWGFFPFKISRYYAELIRGSDYDHPLRRMITPSLEELITYEGQEENDIHQDESQYQPVEGIVHRRPGKLLFFPTLECFAHCRFCYRSGRRVAAVLSGEKMERAISYIRETSEIRDVVITGGDPLTLPLSRLYEKTG